MKSVVHNLDGKVPIERRLAKKKVYQTCLKGGETVAEKPWERAET